jgi:nucleoside-diphosphate-sugar epimerase
VYVSSITVYGRRGPGDGATDENAPLTSAGPWDYYRRAKVAAERVIREILPSATVLRPSWLFGPRDRNSLPRILAELRRGRVMAMVGDGENPVNLLHASEAADAAVLAGQAAVAAGRTYNLSGLGGITQREFFALLAKAAGVSPPRRGMPLRAAYAGALILEAIGRGLGKKSPTRATRYAIDLLTRPVTYSVARAKAELGWQPSPSPVPALLETLRQMHAAGIPVAAT